MVEIRTALMAFACGLAISLLTAKMQADEWKKEYYNLKRALVKHFERELERQKTKWIEYTGEDLKRRYYCAECAQTVKKKVNYCPNCGRKAENND